MKAGNNIQNVRYAVIGLGKFACGKILPSMAAAKNSEIVGLVSGSKEKLARVGEEYQAAYRYTYDTFDECLTNPQIDAVCIVLPNALHEEYAIRAAEAGKHVFCEKPLSIHPDSAERIVLAAKKANVKLMTAYRMHFESTNLELKEKIRAQTFGSIRQIYSNLSTIPDPSNWRVASRALAGGGALFDIGIYSLNNISWLLGEMPEMVEAYTWSTNLDIFKEIEENITFQMRFKNGLQVQCQASYGVASYSQIFVGGEKGWMELTRIYSYHEDPLYRFYSNETGKLEEKKIQRNNEVQAEIEHFSKCVQQNKDPEPSGEEGWRDHKLMEALYESARLKQAVKISV